MKKYKTVISGGTFDHFHNGHESFIRFQLTMSERVLIGITSDTYVSRQKETGIEPFAARQASVLAFVAKEHAIDRVEVAQISDGGIPDIWEKRSIDAIVVTNETKKGADRINTNRIQEGLPVIPIIVFPDVLAEDGMLISSTRIRNGEIDRRGILWIQPDDVKKSFVLPDALRESIQKPFDTLYPSVDDWMRQVSISPNHVIAVGDVVSDALLNRLFYPKGIVVDLFVERERKYSSVQEHTLGGDEVHFSVTNPKGTLQPAVFTVVQESLRSEQRFVLCVQGEEDLLVLPYILCAPLGFVILYGQPKKGVIAVVVSEEKKREARNILEKFIF